MARFAKHPMHFVMTTRALTTTVACLTFAMLSAAAAEENTPEQLITGLHRPAAIAVRPGGTADRFELYIADSGAGRVLRWSNRARNDSSKIIRGLIPAAAADRAQRTDPHALLFLDPGLLVVGTS